MTRDKRSKTRLRIHISGYRLRDLPRLLRAVYRLYRAEARYGGAAVVEMLEQAAQDDPSVTVRREGHGS